MMSMGKKLSIVVLTLAAVGAPLTTAWSLPSMDLDSYVVFAIDSFDFKGKNVTGSSILGGNIGVNAQDSSFNSTPLLNMGEVIMSNGTQVVSDTSRIQDGAVIGDLYTNNQINSGSYTLNGSVQTFTAPLFNPFPTLFSPFSGGSTNVTVNGTLTLPPNSYGSVIVQDGSTLRLQAGVYTMDQFKIGKNVNVYTVPGTIIRIEGVADVHEVDFGMLNGSYFGSEFPGVESIALLQILGDNINFSHNDTFYGELLAPNADINFGNSSNFYGRFIADTVHSDWDDNITYRRTNAVPEPATMALLASGLGMSFLRRRKLA